MLSLLRFARKLLRKRPEEPILFTTTSFEILSDNERLEEENTVAFHNGLYLPVDIGDVFASKYQVTGKLGYGTTSTVWLARDLQSHEYVTLKIYTRGQCDPDEEFQTYKHIQGRTKWHPGHRNVRTASEIFTISRAEGTHKCLVQKPMWSSIEDLLFYDPSHKFSEELLKPFLSQILCGLDYLHRKCQLVHTDVKAENILMDIADPDILHSFVRNELEFPSVRKFVNGKTIYASRTFDRPNKFGIAMIGDLGSAVRGNEEQRHLAQPPAYRSPEVILDAGWSYPIDIWNLACMIWEIFEGRRLFTGRVGTTGEFSTEAYLAEMVAVLGPPPPDFLQRCRKGHEFFDEEGHWKGTIPIPEISLENSEERYRGTRKDEFLGMIRGMLQWRPEDRKTAQELMDDLFRPGMY